MCIPAIGFCKDRSIPPRDPATASLPLKEMKLFDISKPI
jgi:hypothetical protein